MNSYTRLIIACTIITVSILYSVWENKRLKDSINIESETILKKIPQIDFERLNGEKVQLAALAQKNQDKLIFVHFWGTWCAPCASEFPELVKMIDTLKDKKIGFYLVAVNDQVAAVKKFVSSFDKYQNLFTVLIDNSNVHSQFYGTVRVPETYVFEQNGTIIKKFKGPQNWMNSYFVNFFDPYLLK